jgi:cytochrome c oxidase subunit II
MSILLLLAIVAMVFLVIFQIAKASEYVSILKGAKKSREQSNRINGFLMLAFLIFGLVGAYLCHESLAKKTLLPYGSSSVEGEKIDEMFIITLWVTGIVFVITQVLLFWFSFRYQEKEGRKVYYLPHNNRLEIIWTAVPAVVMTVLVVFGLRHWFKITGDAPENAMVVEVTGKQFNWIYRYPGSDSVLGKRDYKLIDEVKGNNLGQDWRDSANKDDVTPSTLYLIKGQPVKLVIGSRDVIHDVGLPAFRLKMDAVPGIPTSLWFTPKYTTKEMREITGNANFNYELVCDQLCGSNHYAMKGAIEVVTRTEFNEWAAKQTSNFYTVFPELKTQSQGAQLDSTQQRIPAPSVTSAATTSTPSGSKREN